MRRATQHIDEAVRLLQAFEQSQSWRVEEGAGRFPNEQAFTLRSTAQVPADTITVIGDAIHNMRSCLDAVAYALAEQYLGRRLTESQMELPSFPICENAHKFEAFLRRRSALYGPIEIEAMRCVQPYALAEEARAVGVAATTPEEERFKWDILRRLNLLWNIDKHRRFPDFAVVPNLPYWTGGDDCTWHAPRPMPLEYVDGTVLGYLECPRGGTYSEPHVVHRLVITFADDVGRDDVGETLKAWHRDIHGWILPLIITMAEGAESRPLGFFYSNLEDSESRPSD